MLAHPPEAKQGDYKFQASLGYIVRPKNQKPELGYSSGLELAYQTHRRPQV